MEALILRIGFWGPLYYNYKKGTAEIVLVIIWAHIVMVWGLGF